jgi:hypothetical protein
MAQHTGGCHCGKVRYHVDIDLDQPVLSCNCSMCSKRGGLLAFTKATDFELESGEDALTDYQFNRNVIHHLFCSTCGILSFGRGIAPDGSEMVAINARCMDGVDLTALDVKDFDGKSI